LSESKATFEEIAKILRPQHSLFLQGRFFNEYAAVLKGLGQSEDDPLLLQEASSYFHQASKCFEQAGNLRHCAAVLNNLGVLLVILGQDNEAEKNFDEARRLFVELKDAVCVAQTDESRAQLFLKIADFEAATEAIVQAVRVLRESGEEALLAESLTTQGIIYARLSRWVEARYSFNEALHTAERCADLEGAGRAALSLVEEMRDHLTYDELREFFARAEYLLAATQSNEVRERLRAGARLLAAAEEAERKRREQAIQDKKMAALGQLASGVAHNFNNALTIIKGRVQILQRMELPGLANKSLDLINETVDDSASMIRRIRDFGRPRTAEDFIRLDIAQIISSAVEMARPRCAGQAIDVLWRTEAPIWVSGDPGELKEVFVNLLYNAVDAIGEAGVIAVSSEIKGQTLELSFSDTGPGMTDEVRSHLFEPFFTTKGEKGTGLGLATCYSIVNAHSGIIEAESALGEGTTFKITMPLYKKPEINLEEPLLVGEHRHQLAALTV
jgi:signal transduction histidine kinase